MKLGTQVWSAGKLLLIVGALAATYLLFAALGMRVAVRSREVQVPHLVGRDVPAASQTVGALGLTLRVDENRRADTQVPAGRIVAQDPPAGVQARRQRSVRVWLSAGTRVAAVPPLVGQTERSARIRLEQDGLAVGAVSVFRSPEYPADAIVAQDPPANAEADAVALLVNRGEQAMSYVMPDLIGVDGEAAADVLRARGFRVTIVGEQPYPGVPPGMVVRQQPAGGFQLAPADAISLEVSR